MSNATCPSSTSLTVTTRTPMTASTPTTTTSAADDPPGGGEHANQAIRLGGQRRSLTGTPVVDRDLHGPRAGPLHRSNPGAGVGSWLRKLGRCADLAPRSPTRP